MICLIFSYSSPVRLCCATISGVITVSFILCSLPEAKTKQSFYRVGVGMSISLLQTLRAPSEVASSQGARSKLVVLLQLWHRRSTKRRPFLFRRAVDPRNDHARLPHQNRHLAAVV